MNYFIKIDGTTVETALNISAAHALLREYADVVQATLVIAEASTNNVVIWIDTETFAHMPDIGDDTAA